MPPVLRKLRSALCLLREDDPWGQLSRRAGENLRALRLGLHRAGPLVYSHANGARYAVVPEVPETREIYLRAQFNYEVVETRVLARWLDPGDFAIDCGANVGLIAALMAARVGRGGRVWAFEPSPSTGRKLEAVLAALRLEQVSIQRRALSDAPGQVQFSDDPDRSEANAIRSAAEYEGRACVAVEAARFEDLLAAASRPPSLVKMDIEGAEPLAFRGWPSLASVAAPPLFLFEVYPRGLTRLSLTPADIFRAMPLERYRLWHLNASHPNDWPRWPRGVPFQLDDPFAHEWPMHSNVVAVPREGAFAGRAARLRDLLPGLA